jgi:flagellar hook-associated protein 2
MTVPFNISGIASNIDTNSILQKLLEIEGAGVRRLKAQQTEKTSYKTGFETLATKLSTLKSRVTALKSTSAFDAKTVTVADSAVFSATAQSNSASGTYDVTVLQRSRATRLVGAAGVSNGTALDLSKKLNDAGNNLATAVTGSTGDPAVGQFEITNGTTTVAINYTLSVDSLQDVIDRINASAAGVTASYDSLSDRILVTSKTGGTDAVTVEDVTNGGNLATAFKLTAASSAQGVLGQFAQIKIEGVNLDNNGNAQAISSKDDIFTSGETGLSGMSFTLKASSGSSQVTVGADTTAIRQKFDDFITAYNDVVKYITSNSTKGTGTNTSMGIFSGDASVQRLSREMRTIAASTVAGLSTDMKYLRGIGIGTATTAPDLSVLDSTRLSTVINERGADLKTLMTATDGIMTRLDTYLSQEITGSTGLIRTKADRFTGDLARIKDNIKTQNLRLEKKEEQLRKQFAAMERAIASLGAGGIGAMLSAIGQQGSN